jgi:hypothetical protein
MAARNIRSIFMSMAMNNDERPIRFRWPVNNTTPTINAKERTRKEATSLIKEIQQIDYSVYPGVGVIVCFPTAIPTD